MKKIINRNKALEYIKRGVGLSNYRHFWGDEEIIKIVVSHSSSELEYAPESIKNNVDLMHELVGISPYAIMYGGKEIKSNKKIALKALSVNGWLLKNVDKELLHDKDIVLRAVESHETILLSPLGQEIISIWKNDESVMRQLILLCPLGLKYASEELKNDKNLIIKLVEKEGQSYDYISEELKKDEDIALVAIKKNYHCIKYVGANLRNDKNFAFKVLKEGPSILFQLSKDLQSDCDILEEYFSLYNEKVKKLSFEFFIADKENKILYEEAKINFERLKEESKISEGMFNYSNAKRVKIKKF